MSIWWRAYNEAINDPKLQRLSGDLFKTWFNLLCLASGNNGLLPSISDIAFALRLPDKEVEKRLQTLVDSGLFDVSEDGTQPHNWRFRQFKSDVSTERVNRFRNRKRNVSSTVSRNVSETANETPPETETETEKKEPFGTPSVTLAVQEPPALSLVPTPTPEAELFRRGREVLGKQAGGLITQLLKSRGGNVALARSVIEVASTKGDPKQYLGGVLRGPDKGEDAESFERKRERGEAW